MVVVVVVARKRVEDNDSTGEWRVSVVVVVVWRWWLVVKDRERVCHVTEPTGPGNLPDESVME